MAKVNQEIQNLRRDEHHMLLEVVTKCVDDSVKMRMGQLCNELGPGSSGALEKEKFTSSSPEAQIALNEFWDTIQSNFDSDGDDKTRLPRVFQWLCDNVLSFHPSLCSPERLFIYRGGISRMGASFQRRVAHEDFIPPVVLRRYIFKAVRNYTNNRNVKTA